MLEKLTVRNFKKFEEAEIDLGSPVVFIGPNNSGKTSAMQALALWDIGLRHWLEKRSGKAPNKRPGITVSRRDVLAAPVPAANLLWHQLHTRRTQRISGKQRTDNIRIDVIVEGISRNASSGTDEAWRCGLEFDYANEESFYCRPLRSGGRASDRMEVPKLAGQTSVAFLPPMSGLATSELRLESGAIRVRIGEGRTADVLRNLCYMALEDDQWESLAQHMAELFGVELEQPRYIEKRGEITMGYKERGIRLDLSASGRGLQQTLLLLAYMHINPGSVILLDEPDAHLEILRQRQMYKRLMEVAESRRNQLIIASHSEVLLEEASRRDDSVVAFIGAPHPMLGRGEQVQKALREIGFNQYYQAEQKGWVLYLEGPTDLAILQAFAKRLNHEEAMRALERPFVRYVGNQPGKAKDHLYGIREALPNIEGVILLDRIEREAKADAAFHCLVWKKREIENYLCTQAALEAYASASADELGPLLAEAARTTRLKAMREAIEEVATAMQTLDKGEPWADETKASEDVLVPVFKSYANKLNLYNDMPKSNFHRLVEHIPEDEVNPEIREKLDGIAHVAGRAGSGTE